MSAGAGQKGPRPEDVAEALRSGRAPSAMLDDPVDQAAAAAVPVIHSAPGRLSPVHGAVDHVGGGAGGLESPPVRAAGVTVRTVGPALIAARNAAVATAVADGVPAALAARDATLWGSEAAAEASVRLGWLDLPTTSRELLPRLEALRTELAAEGLDRVVLCGMGGSSLAPEVICRTAGVELTVLDTTDTGQVRAALDDRLDRTVVVVSSKSGGTVETDSHRRIFAAAFLAAGVDKDAVGRRFVAVTDPGSPLEETARAEGFREVFLADPDVGGRYSALSAFGLVPSALAGADVSALLDEASDLMASLGSSSDNPSLALGAALGGAGVAGRDKVILLPAGNGPVGFGDWAEQLVAESTGKDGKGLLPVVLEGPDSPGAAEAGDVHVVALGGELPGPNGTEVSGPLGAQFLAWEYATAVAGRELSVNPFDQPNVSESKANTAAILDESGDAPLSVDSPAFTEGAVEVYADSSALAGASTLSEVLAAVLAAVPQRGYLALLAYLDRGADAEAARLRVLLAERTSHPVTWGWGPRFLHSTGQFHKGGPSVGVFLQLTGVVADDLEVPGMPYTLGRLQAAQALGDMRALTKRSRPAVRLHLLDRAVGVAEVLGAARRRAASGGGG